MKPAQLDRVSYRGLLRGERGGRGEEREGAVPGLGPCPPPAPRRGRYPAALPGAGVVYSRSPPRAANGQRLPAPWPARLRAALVAGGWWPAAPATCPAPPPPPPAPQTLRRAARRSLCECVRGVCAPAAPSRAAGVTAPLNGWRARPSARRPMAGRLISRGVLWRCPGCMALCGAAFRGRRGGGAPLRAAPRSGPAARCPPARRPRRGECAPPAAPRRATGGTDGDGQRRAGRRVPSPHTFPSAPRRRGSPPPPRAPPPPRRWRPGGRRGASPALRGGCRGSQSLFLRLLSPAFV